MTLRAEFTVEPFVPGAPGPHVHAAIDAVGGRGLTVDVGPFGTSGEGADESVLAAVDAATRAAFAAGATRVSVQISRI